MSRIAATAPHRYLDRDFMQSQFNQAQSQPLVASTNIPQQQSQILSFQIARFQNFQISSRIVRLVQMLYNLFPMTRAQFQVLVNVFDPTLISLSASL
jgi:hypothetical protein